ncbi:NUDIX hydrolase [Streptomyces albidoflavus]|uniref:NUDIX hydrolase n=1 Tax=Streptomyces albidoflavus TaxID=1886 RepID=UPI0033E720BC
MTEQFETIRYTADIICIRDGHILTIERGSDPHKGQLALPGGHVDPGETSRAAAARELAEETNIHIQPDDLTFVGIWDTPNRDPRGRYITAAYAITVPTSTLATAGDDAASVYWVPIDNPGPLAFDHQDIVAAARRH